MRGNKQRFHRLLLEPKTGTSAESVAEKLIELKKIEEVRLIAEDRCYIIKTRFYDNQDAASAVNYIKKGIGSRFGTILYRP